MAFAVYTAPSAFVRAGPTIDQDKQAFERGAPFVHVKPVFIPTGGGMVEGEKVRIKVKRPLVFLVYGIWSCDQTWDNFAPLIGNAPFLIDRADYRDAENGSCTASRDFATVAPIVYQNLQGKIETYKMTSNVAAVQAEIVAHSMGGLVTRTMALDPKFLNDPAYPTFGKGPVRRLITIGSPHQGTRLANYLPGTRCVRGYFEDIGMAIAGGIQDLAVGSAALQRLNSGGQTPFSVHTIVGLASSGQRLGANTELIGYVALKSIPSVVIQTPSVCWINLPALSRFYRRPNTTSWSRKSVRVAIGRESAPLPLGQRRIAVHSQVRTNWIVRPLANG